MHAPEGRIHHSFDPPSPDPSPTRGEGGSRSYSVIYRFEHCSCFPQDLFVAETHHFKSLARQKGIPSRIPPCRAFSRMRLAIHLDDQTMTEAHEIHDIRAYRGLTPETRPFETVQIAQGLPEKALGRRHVQAQCPCPAAHVWTDARRHVSRVSLPFPFPPCGGRPGWGVIPDQACACRAHSSFFRPPSLDPSPTRGREKFHISASPPRWCPRGRP